MLDYGYNIIANTHIYNYLAHQSCSYGSVNALEKNSFTEDSYSTINQHLPQRD